MSELPQVRARTGAQLALTIFAVVLALVAFGLVELGLGQNLGRHLPEYGVLFVVGYVATYLLIRYLAPTADPALFPSAALLAGIGFAVIYRLAPGQSAEQASWLAIGLCAFALTLAGVGALTAVRVALS